MIAPGKRPMHTIIPALAMRGGRCVMPFGVMGADYQPMGHMQVVTNIVDYGMDVQAGDRCAARVLRRRDHRDRARRLGAGGRGLKARGHNVVLRPAPHGGGQAI